VESTDLHRRPSDGWPTYFGAAAYHCPVQAGDEAPGGYLMSVSMGREIQKNNSLFQVVLFLALLSKFSLNNNYGADQPRGLVVRVSDY
jgi:hypothetical protein